MWHLASKSFRRDYDDTSYPKIQKRPGVYLGVNSVVMPKYSWVVRAYDPRGSGDGGQLFDRPRNRGSRQRGRQDREGSMKKQVHFWNNKKSKIECIDKSIYHISSQGRDVTCVDCLKKIRKV